MTRNVVWQLGHWVSNRCYRTERVSCRSRRAQSSRRRRGDIKPRRIALRQPPAWFAQNTRQHDTAAWRRRAPPASAPVARAARQGCSRARCPPACERSHRPTSCTSIGRATPLRRALSRVAMRACGSISTRAPMRRAELQGGDREHARAAAVVDDAACPRASRRRAIPDTAPSSDACPCRTRGPGSRSMKHGVSD